MKFFAVFSALLAVACASNTWTLQQLGDAIESPYTDPALKPYLETALNDMMTSIWAGQQVEAVTVTLPSMDFSSWTVNQLGDAIQNPETDPNLIPHLEAALNHMMEALFTGVPVAAASVSTPAMELHYYTLHDISLALQSPTTNPELVPYLEHALNEMMDALFAGHQMAFTVIAVPVGLNPVDTPAEVLPAPVEDIVPVLPTPAESSPVAPASPASPLVQIIVNINQQEAAAVPVSPVVIPPTPVQVVDNAPVVDPVQVVDTAPVEVDPVQVVEPEIIVPGPVIVPSPIVVEPVVVPSPIVVEPVVVPPIVAEPVVVPSPIVAEPVVVPSPIIAEPVVVPPIVAEPVVVPSPVVAEPVASVPIAVVSPIA